MADIYDRFAEAEEEVDLQADKYLTFLIDRQYYAFPIKDVIEIIEVQEVTGVPEFPPFAKGIINLRGNIIPIIDVRLRFRKPEAEYTERTCIVVVSINDMNVGYIVDTVDEVLDIGNEDIAPPPAVSSSGHSGKYITGVGKTTGKIVLLLDATKMLNDEEIAQISDNI